MSAVGELREIALGALTVDPAAFSPRAGGLEPRHVADLADRLADGVPLDPIVVWSSGGKLRLVDGFHRVAAYRKAGWQSTVPARVIVGDIVRALEAAFAENGKAHLPLSPGERQDFAWRVVRMEQDAKRKRVAKVAMTGDDRALAGLSKRDVAAMTGASERNVANMRKAASMACAGEIELTGLWWRDRRKVFGEDDQVLSDEERKKRRERDVQQLAHDLRPLSPAWRRNEEIAFEALKRVLGDERTAQLAHMLRSEIMAADFADDAGRVF